VPKLDTWVGVKSLFFFESSPPCTIRFLMSLYATFIFLNSIFNITFSSFTFQTPTPYHSDEGAKSEFFRNNVLTTKADERADCAFLCIRSKQYTVRVLFLRFFQKIRFKPRIGLRPLFAFFSQKLSFLFAARHESINDTSKRAA
jgi:hypothetical protein